MKPVVNHSFTKIYWRRILMIMIVFGSLAIMFSLPRFGQDPSYHSFADQREFFGIPNFFDVISNFAFLFVGIAGLRICFKKHLGRMRHCWLILFSGVSLVSIGSAYYHSNPIDHTLVWDRLPMTIGFTGLFVALLGEYISEKFRLLIIPALLLGLSSVVYWQWSDDLRFYIWVQTISLLIIPLVMILYRSHYSHQWMLLVALLFYALAKIAELNDKKIFELSSALVSGHTIKHLLAALGCLVIALMLQKRKLLER